MDERDNGMGRYTVEVRKRSWTWRSGREVGLGGQEKKLDLEVRKRSWTWGSGKEVGGHGDKVNLEVR